MRSEARVSYPLSAELVDRWNATDVNGVTARERVLASLIGPADESGTRTIDRDLRGIRLVGANLVGADLSECDLTGADLTDANLTDARLVQSQLTHATLVGADLTRCELQSAKLEGAHLESARAERANFTDANLRGASLYGANLSHASFLSADLEGAELHATNLSRAMLRSANLKGVDLSRSDLRGAVLVEAHVKGAVFHGANLQKAELRNMRGFERASFLGVDVREINLSGAYRLRRHILDENYLHEFRQRSLYHRAIYFLWWITSDCGRSLLRWTAWAAAIVVVFSVLFATTTVNYGDHPTTLSPFYFSLQTFTMLGYGDVVPASMTAQILCMIEVAIGYGMFAGLISVLVTKMGRRGE